MCDICQGVHACRSGCPNAPPEETITCPRCGQEIDPGDYYYRSKTGPDEGEIIGCEWCIKEYTYGEDEFL